MTAEIMALGRNAPDYRRAKRVRFILESEASDPPESADLVRALAAVATNTKTKEQWEQVRNWVGDWKDG